MEPRIQYARTADGVNIAFWTLGEGMPLVYMPPIAHTHAEIEWQWPEYRRWYQRLAERRKLVRYDGRGTGLSQRDVADYSPDKLMADLEGVVDHLGLETFALFASYYSGPLAIAYAARHPERVSHLVLWCTSARASDLLRSPPFRGLGRLLDTNWETYTDTLAHIWSGWSGGESARRAAALYRESVTPEAFRAATAAIREFDVTDLLPKVKHPTLVLHRRQLRLLDLNHARGLASSIPDGRLAILDGELPPPFLGDSEAVAIAIDEFLGEGQEAAAVAVSPSGLVTVLFTDMEGSITLTQRLGDAKAQELLRTHNTIVRDALKAYAGSEIKHTGDGIMASFPSASRAIECAVAIQKTVVSRMEEHAETPLRVRIGLNAGEPIAEDEDLFGTAVQLARRICDRAQPGQILASNVVQELAAGKGFVFADQGEASLKGYDRPVRLYEVRWEG